MSHARILAALLPALTVTAATADDAPASGSAAAVFAHIAPSIVTVRAFDAQDALLAQGSGVTIAKGRVATNCHVVDEAQRIEVESGGSALAATWLRVDPSRDLCLLAADGLSAAPVVMRQVASVAVGERVIAIGNPLGFGMAVSEGLVVAVGQKVGPGSIVTSAPLSPGSSGGGLFDQDGRLLGLTTAILGTGQSLNLALAADGLAQLEATGVAPPAPSEAPTPEPNWKAEADALVAVSAWDRLVALAKNWTNTQPEAAPAWIRLAQAQAGAKRLDEARRSLDEALRLDPDNTFGWAIKANMLFDSGDRAGAERALERARTLQPNSALPLRLLAGWRLDAGRFAEGRELARQATALEPADPSGWRTLAAAERGQGRHEAASKAVAVALALDRAADGEATAGAGMPGDRRPPVAAPSTASQAESLMQLGETERARGRLAAAHDAYRKAVELAPNDASAWNGLGVVLVNLARSAEAEPAFDRAVALDARNAEALANRGVIRHDLGRRQEGLDDVKAAVELAPTNETAWRSYGAVMQRMGDCRSTVDAFTKLDKLGRARPDDLVSLGECQGVSGDLAQGLATLARAEAANPKLVRMHLSTAKLLGAKGDVAKALGYLERALMVEPSNVMAWSSKGYALMLLDRLPESAEALETAVRLDPNSANAWINLGQTSMRRRNLSRAIESLEKAVALNADALDARLSLGQAYLATRQAARARQQAAIVVERAPRAPGGLGLQTLAMLAEGDTRGAASTYARLKALDASFARKVRAQALAAGLTQATALPE